MSMLSRYRKSGGFVQILQLIETCGKKKQDNFLRMIEEEDPKWAEALQEKMLTMDKILDWDDNTVAEIFSRVQEMTLATAAHGFTPEQYEKVTKMFSHSQKRAELNNNRTFSVSNAFRFSVSNNSKRCLFPPLV